MFDPDGEPVNGKRTTRIHDFDAPFDPERKTLSVVAGDGPGMDHRTFDREAAKDWLSEFFDIDVSLRGPLKPAFLSRFLPVACLFVRFRRLFPFVAS